MSFIHSPTTLVCCHLPFCNTSFRMDVDLMRLVPKPVLISTSTQVNDCVFLLQAHIRGADHDACFLIFVVRSRCMLPHICGAITMHASSYSWCDHNAGFLIFMVPITMHAFSYLWCDHNACFLIIIVSYVHTGKKTFCLAFQMLFSLNPFARSHFRPTFDCYYSFPLLLVVDEWSVPCVLCV